MKRIALKQVGRLALFCAVVSTVGLLLAATATAGPVVIASGLDDPRGIALGPGKHVFVAESLTGEITKLHGHRDGWPATTLATAPGVVDVARSKHGKIYAVLGAPVSELVRIKKDGSWKVVADIGAYQANDPDPYDQEAEPTESNANGLALLRDGRILVTDAANNDLLLVKKNGKIKTVARFPTREVPYPEGIPGPPAGSPFDAESVPTSVAVGPDGAWYVSELRGFPFTPGSSQIWRIKPWARGADCATSRKCQVYRDGYTSVIDLAFGKKSLLVLEIAKEGLLAVEAFGAPPIGGLWVDRHGNKKELAEGELLAPGGVAVSCKHKAGIFVTTGTIFGAGAGEVVRLGQRSHHNRGFASSGSRLRGGVC